MSPEFTSTWAFERSIRRRSSIKAPAEARCRHGRANGTYARADALGAFVEPPSSLARSEPQGSVGQTLDDLRVAVKDNIDVAGWPTRAGSPATPGTQASQDATVVRLLKHAGAAVGAKTRMDEFAFTTHGPDMRNPNDPDRSAGGSSGGSGIAVAAGGFCAAIGTDTGGSVRIPAAYNGVVGLKPTYAAIPVEGVIPLSPTLDHVGILACTAAVAKQVFEAASEASPFMGAAPSPAGEAPLQGLRIGVPTLTHLAASTSEVRESFYAAIRDLRRLGATLVEVALPNADDVMAVHYPIVLIEGVRYQDERFADFSKHGQQLQQILRRARAYSQEDYDIALAGRDQLSAAVNKLYEDIDVLALPTTPTVGPRRDEEAIRLGDGAYVDPVTASIWYTALFNDTGHPAISLPCQPAGRLPVGLQLVAQHGADRFLLDTAYHIDRQLHSRRASAKTGKSRA